MRFGKPLAEFDPDRRKNHLFGEYQPPLSVLADAAGFAIDEWTAEGGVAAAKHDTTIVAGEIKAGTAAAQRIISPGVAAEQTASASPSTASSRWTSTLTGTCGPPAGGSASTATPRST